MKTTKRKLACIVCICVMILASVPLWYRATEGGGVGTLGGGGPSPVNTGYEPWYYYVGDMVNSGSGNLFLHEVDLSVGARGFRMQIVRAYNSDDNSRPGPFGYGWTYNFNLIFALGGAGDLVYHDGDGSKHLFTLNVQGGYDSPPGKSLRLTPTATGPILWEKTGTKYYFNSTYVLTRIEDKNGNNLTISYDISSRITSIADDSNLMLNFTYNGSRISQITDALNRTVKYSYDVNGDLINVTYPNNGVIKYTYYHNHLMNYVVDQVGKKTRFVFDTPRPASHAKVRSIYYSALIGGNESMFYEAFNLTYTAGATAIRNARGYTTTLNINSNGSATRVDGPSVGSIFLGTYGRGEALEEPCQASCPVDGSSCSRKSTRGACSSRGGCTGGATSSTCSGCSQRDGLFPCLWPSPAKNLFRSLSARSQSVEIGWDSDFNIESLKDALTNTYNFTYDSKRNTLSAKDPSQNTTSYSWNDIFTSGFYVSELKNATNPRNYQEDFTYDNSSNLLSYQNALEDYTNYTYTPHGLVKNVTNALGNTWEYYYSNHGFLTVAMNPLYHATTYGSDLVGRVVNATSPGGNVTSYYYDSVDNLIAIMDPLGNSTNVTYNLRGDLTGIKDANGHWTNYSVGVVLANVVSIVDASGNVTTISYDSVGNPISTTNRRNYTTVIEYDQYDRPTKVTDPLLNSTEYNYNSDGTISSMTDAGNNTVVISYDAVARVTNITDPTGNSTIYEYDEVGNVKVVKNARGYQTTFSYNALNQVLNVTDAMGNSTDYEYDEVGNMVKITDAMGHSRQAEYDSIGRLVKDIDPLNHTTTFSYDTEGNMINLTDANGHTTLFDYDALGRVIKITNARGNITEVGYDSVGNILSIKDPEGHTTNLTYDELNRLVTISSPLGNKMNMSYDANGNVISREDSNGVNTTYLYDALDRSVLVSYPSGVNISFAYDALGRMTQISSSEGYNETRSYDGLGRLSSLQVMFGPLNETLHFYYDEVGNLVKVTYPDGKNVTFQYDGNDRQEAITDWSNGTWSTKYNANGRRTELQHPNGVTTYYTYDNASRFIGILSKTSANVTLLNLSYTYDSVGNILSMSDGNGNSTSYVYDEDDQLVQSNDSSDGLTNYTYDGIGNRIWKVNGSNSTQYVYNAENQLTSGESYNYTYDNNGNMISRSNGGNQTNYTYDYENRLVQVDLPDNSTVSYDYSPLSYLIRRNQSGSVSYLLNGPWPPWGYENILVKYNDSGDAVAHFVYGPQVDEPLKMQAGNSSIFYHSDFIGSVRMVTNSTGGVVDRFGYGDFGLPVPQTYASDNFHLFTGRTWDNITKLYHYRARWFDPVVGRFLTKDPSGFAGGLNLYAYVMNNPINRNDPSGLGCWFGGRWCYVWEGGEWGFDWNHFTNCLGAVITPTLRLALECAIAFCIAICAISLGTFCIQCLAFCLLPLEIGLILCFLGSIRYERRLVWRYVCYPEAWWRCVF